MLYISDKYMPIQDLLLLLLLLLMHSGSVLSVNVYWSPPFVLVLHKVGCVLLVSIPWGLQDL